MTPAELAQEIDALADRIGLAKPCDDCGRSDRHADDCTQLPLPEVVAIGRNRWIVASRSVAPGSYWPVTLTHQGGHSVMRCCCPAGRRLDDLSLTERYERNGCRHLVAVVRFESDLHRRPEAPVNASKWVD
jgi:hypothetical protein